MESEQFCVFDGESQKIYSKLSRDGVTQIRQQVPADKLDVWFFWTPGLSEWISLAQCDEKLGLQSNTPRLLSVVHSKSSSYKVAPPPPWIRGERRLHARHDVELRVVLISQEGAVYRTKSKNVSFGGALVDGSLPASMHENFFKIYLSHERFPEKIQVRGRFVPSDVRGNQIAFVYWNQHERALFEKWLSVLKPGQAKAPQAKPLQQSSWPMKKAA